MNDPLPPDVLALLTQVFGNRADAVAAILLAPRGIGSENRMDDRLVRCIVYAAGGDEARAQQLFELGLQDYRDLIVAGEYDCAMQRIRDLRASFLIDSPEKFWIGEVACVMAARGYVLSSLETHPATTGPFNYTADFGEGTATFVGPKGKIEIERRDRQWFIHGNPRELEMQELNHAFNDARTFRDALSCYLLSRPK
jgi:hypothetical protein